MDTGLLFLRQSLSSREVLIRMNCTHEEAHETGSSDETGVWNKVKSRSRTGEEIKTQGTHLTTSPRLMNQRKRKNWKKIQHVKNWFRESTKRKTDTVVIRAMTLSIVCVCPSSFHFLIILLILWLPGDLNSVCQAIALPCIIWRYGSSLVQLSVSLDPHPSTSLCFAEGSPLEILSLLSTLFFLPVPVYFLCRYTSI